MMDGEAAVTPSAMRGAAMWSARQEAAVFKRATGHRLAVERDECRRADEAGPSRHPTGATTRGCDDERSKAADQELECSDM